MTLMTPRDGEIKKIKQAYIAVVRQRWRRNNSTESRERLDVPVLLASLRTQLSDEHDDEGQDEKTRNDDTADHGHHYHDHLPRAVVVVVASC